MKSDIKILALIITLIVGCQKENPDGPFKSCNLTGENIIRVENKVGTLIYADTLPQMKLSDTGYYIENSNVEDLCLPLEVCNLPTGSFSSLNVGDSVEVSFIGRIELLPETADAVSLLIELERIEPTE
jgi:hypothetical protein